MQDQTDRPLKKQLRRTIRRHVPEVAPFETAGRNLTYSTPLYPAVWIEAFCFPRNALFKTDYDIGERTIGQGTRFTRVHVCRYSLQALSVRVPTLERVAIPATGLFNCLAEEEIQNDRFWRLQISADLVAGASANARSSFKQ